MQTLLGSFLRQFRCARGLSQIQAAQAVAISHATLSRWESGTRRPHASDLEALLRGLAATPQEQQQALSLLKTLQHPTRTRDLIAQTKSHSAMGPMPHNGTLLWAMRMRRGLSQEDLARQIGVTERTLRRWEKSEVEPSPAQVQTLCYILGAPTEEMLALTTGEFSASTASEEVHTASLEEILAQLHELYFNLKEEHETLRDLCFLRLEAQAWPHALRSQGGREVLARIYSYHASSLSAFERWSESSVYAERVLDLLPGSASPQKFHVMAALASARASVYRSARPQPEKGIDLLRHWSDVTPWPEYQAWIVSDIAKYMALAGDAQSGLFLTQQAREVAKHCEERVELEYRELDEAQALILAGQPAQALLLTQRHLDRVVGITHLIEGEAFLSLSDSARAQARLQEAWQFIEARNLGNMRPRAQRLEARLKSCL